MNRQKILIVDDSELNREMLKAILGEEYDYAEAEDGAQAILMLQQDLLPSILDEIHALYSPPQDGQCHQKSPALLDVTASAPTLFFSDHSLASCGYCEAKSLKPFSSL